MCAWAYKPSKSGTIQVIFSVQWCYEWLSFYPLYCTVFSENWTHTMYYNQKNIIHTYYHPCIYVYIYPHTSGGDIGTTSRRVFMTNFGAPTDKTGGYLHYSVPSPDSSRFASLSRPAGCLSRSSLHPGHVPPGFPLLWPFSTESMPQATSLVSYMSNASVMRSG